MEGHVLRPLDLLPQSPVSNSSTLKEMDGCSQWINIPASVFTYSPIVAADWLFYCSVCTLHSLIEMFGQFYLLTNHHFDSEQTSNQSHLWCDHEFTLKASLNVCNP